MILIACTRLAGNFNCTIQELKLNMGGKGEECTLHFNCTIQELKLS